MKSHSSLLNQLVVRELQTRYKGSFLGLAWSFVTPLLMLLVYTFVFRFVFNARWPDLDPGAGALDFTAVLFVGLIVNGMASDVLGRSASVISENANYVKKIVFPLELLPLVLLVNASVNFCIGSMLVVVFTLIAGMPIHWTFVLAPLVFIPFFVLLLGLSLLLAALGVYIRDIQQVMGTVTAMMLFVSPVLYSIAALPDWLKYIIYLNPISIPVETFRSVMLFGHLPDWSILALYSVVACGVFILGSAFFTRCRSGFADVI